MGVVRKSAQEGGREATTLPGFSHQCRIVTRLSGPRGKLEGQFVKAGEFPRHAHGSTGWVNIQCKSRVSFRRKTTYKRESGKIMDVTGGISLCANGECAASWSYLKLMEHWKKKHGRAAYVPNQAKIGPPRQYRYSNRLLLGEGTDFTWLLNALVSGFVYYDPGIKMENASTKNRKIKWRSQFRVKAKNLRQLYRSFESYPV